MTHDQFEYIVQEFEDRGDYRMVLVCLLMAKCIRIGDILKTIRKKDAFTPKGQIRPRMRFKEEKTCKERIIVLVGKKTGTKLITALKAYQGEIKQVPRDEEMFYGRKTGEPLRDKGVKFLLSKFVGHRNIEQCSPHSFRKYGAKFMYQNGVDIEVISQILNHQSVRETRTYLDIKPQEVENAMEILEY
ncbi:tyrosine-type recombinase/integrase [Fibrobacterota bacterium]